MNWNISNENWVDLKIRVKSKRSKLTDENLNAIAGHRFILDGKIQDFYGITEGQAEKNIKHFEKNNKDNFFKN